MDWSSRRVFPRLGLVVAVLLVATLVNWEVPARALGLDSASHVCDWPDPLEEPSDPSLVVRLATCPRSDRPTSVQVWLQGRRPARDVEARLRTSGHVVAGATNVSRDTARGPTLLLSATVDFSGRSRHEVDAVAEMTVPRELGGFRETTRSDRVGIELSPSCTLAYRGARPAGRWRCPR